jgi:hypothetical protein
LFWSLVHRDFLNQVERRQIDDQIRLTWRVAPGELADLARHVPGFFGPIASALESTPGAPQQFVAALALADPSASDP